MKKIKNYFSLLFEGLPHFFEAVSYMKAAIIGFLLAVVFEMIKGMDFYSLMEKLIETTLILIFLCIFISCPIIAAEKRKKKKSSK
jgi:hypothetical protein